MKIVRPGWMHHEGAKIHSVDIHPDGTKLLSAGGGVSRDGLVQLWLVRGLFEEDTDAAVDNCMKRPAIFKLELDSCANCVRWCPTDGQLFALADNDGAVMVYKYHARVLSHGSIGSKDSAGHVMEQWKCAHTIRANANFVLHLEWSPCGTFMACCGADCTILIFNVHKNYAKAAELTGHKEFVKGLAWDPMMKYLASQSSDGSLKIWDLKTYTVVKSVEEPFSKTSKLQTALVSRCSWSADGMHVIGVNASNEDAATAQVIDRCFKRESKNKDTQNTLTESNTWPHDRDLAGHQRATLCSRWSSVMYEASDQTTANGSNSNAHKQRTASSVLALSGVDGTLSIWLYPVQRRPRCVIKQMAAKTIFDCVWSRSGLELYVCSEDGTIAALQFEALDFGRPLSRSEFHAHLRVKYSQVPEYMLLQPIDTVTNGQSTSNGHANTVTDTEQLITDPKLLIQKEQETSEAKGSVLTELRADTQSMNSTRDVLDSVSSLSSCNDDVIMLDDCAKKAKTASPPRTAATQSEMRDKNGRRRITPLFIPMTVLDNNDTVIKPKPVAAPPPTETVKVTQPITSQSALEASSQSALRTAQQSQSAPDMISQSTLRTAQQSQSATESTQDKREAALKRRIGSKRIIESDSDDDNHIDKCGLPSTSQSTRNTFELPPQIARVRDCADKDMRVLTAGPAHKRLTARAEGIIRRAPNIDLSYTRVVNVSNEWTRANTAHNELTELVIADELNYADMNDTTESVHADANKQVLPVAKTWLPHPCVALACSRSHIACALSDCSVHVLDHNSRCVVPAFVLHAPVIHVQCEKARVLAVTADARCYVWNVAERRCEMDGQMLTPLLNAPAGTTIVRESLLPVTVHSTFGYSAHFNQEQPISIALSTGHVQSVHEPINALNRMARTQFELCTAGGTDIAGGTVTLKEHKLSMVNSQAQQPQTGCSTLKAQLIVCEQTLVSSLIRLTGSQHKHLIEALMLKYVQCLVLNADHGRARALCAELSDTATSTSTTSMAGQSNSMIAHLLSAADRTRFLTELVLPTLQENADFRTISDEFAQHTDYAARFDQVLEGMTS